MRKQDQLVEDLNGVYGGYVVVDAGKHDRRRLIYPALIKMQPRLYSILNKSFLLFHEEHLE